MTRVLETSSFENETPIALHAQAGMSLDYNIRDISLVSGPAKGVSFEGNIVRISQALCAGLTHGDVQSILMTYSVVGRYGYEIPKTAIFNLSKTKDGPMISSPIFHEPFISNGTAYFDLLSDYAA